MHLQQKLMEGSVETVVSTADAEQRASLEVIRLTGEEVEFRPVQLAGDLSEASPSAVAGAVRMKQAGPFNAFSMPPGSEGQQFVVRLQAPCYDLLPQLCHVLNKKMLSVHITRHGPEFGAILLLSQCRHFQHSGVCCCRAAL